MEQAYNYLIHLLAALALLATFVFVYTKVTPFDEFALIKQGHTAAALSLGGAMLGVSLTLGSSIVHGDTFMMFLIWGSAAGAVQVAAYALLSRILPHLDQALSENNVAMGAFMGAVSLVVGVLNAACLS
ncbi:MAG: DUF350 domain-containing protein [Rhodocyclaceae bacterium]|nr:DUF350 domain-containing protein [Rhodocyclaceae bacterium]